MVLHPIINGLFDLLSMVEEVKDNQEYNKNGIYVSFYTQGGQQKLIHISYIHTVRITSSSSHKSFYE